MCIRDRVVNGIAIRRPHLPDGVMAVSVTAGATEQVTVKRPSNIRTYGMTEVFGIERNGVVLINRFPVQHRLDRRAVVIRPGLVVAARELGLVAILAHIE